MLKPMGAMTLSIESDDESTIPMSKLVRMVIKFAPIVNEISDLKVGLQFRSLGLKRATNDWIIDQVHNFD